MIYLDTIKGKYVDLKYAKIEDAEVILQMRQDPDLTKFLPRLDITVAEQRKWIEKQQIREGDYYFVVWSKKGKAIGTIRVYNIHGGQGETGSLVLSGNAFENLEAKLLCEDFQWDILNLESTTGFFDVNNIQAQKFAALFGAWFGETGYDEERGIHYVLSHNDRCRSVEYRNKVRKLLYKENM